MKKKNMNRDKYKILKVLITEDVIDQRKISQLTKLSLGKVNNLLKELNRRL